MGNKPLGNSLVPYGTPLHVAELLLTLFKITFNETPDDWPYKYTEDYETTGILFDTSFNRESGIWGKKPLIVVYRGAQSTNPIVVGDLAGQSLFTSNAKRTSLVQSSTEVNIVARRKAETEILGQQVFNTLMLGRIILPQQTGIQTVTNISMSPVSKFEQDDTMFIISCSFQYIMQYIWEHTIPQTILAGTQLNLTNKGR